MAATSRQTPPDAWDCPILPEPELTKISNDFGFHPAFAIGMIIAGGITAAGYLGTAVYLFSQGL